MKVGGWLTLALCALGCNAGGTDTDIGVPPDTSSALIEDTEPFPVDTSSGALDDEPDHTVTLIEQGTWSLTPLGGPYTSLVGSMTIIEYIDGPPDQDDTALPPCMIEFALTGIPAPADCPNCTITFEVLHQLVSGDLSMCHDPDRPFQGESRRLGFDPNTNRIRWQRGSLWFDWYQAQLVGDQLTFSYTTTLGVAVEEDN